MVLFIVSHNPDIEMDPSVSSLSVSTDSLRTFTKYAQPIWNNERDYVQPFS